MSSVYTYIGGPLDGRSFVPNEKELIVDDGTYAVVVLANNRYAWYLRKGSRLVFDMICDGAAVIKLPPEKES